MMKLMDIIKKRHSIRKYTDEQIKREDLNDTGGKKMDLQTCLKKMQLVGVLAFATVDAEGAPQVRNISAIHYEENALYFFTARGKNFCKELLSDGRVQILCYTKYKR